MSFSTGRHIAACRMLSAHSMGLEQCFALSERGSSLGKSKAGAALDALPGERRDVAGSKLQGTFHLGLSPAGAA